MRASVAVQQPKPYIINFLFLAFASVGIAIVIGVVNLARHPVIGGYPHIIDGDTIVLQGKHIRLYGIDAPEIAQTCTSPKGLPWDCGVEAKKYLERLTNKIYVVCRHVDTDKWGRTIAVCKADGLDLGHTLVHDGLAVAYHRYSEKYRFEEVQAINAKRGIWAGKFQHPENWRRENHRGTD